LVTVGNSGGTCGSSNSGIRASDCWASLGDVQPVLTITFKTVGRSLSGGDGRVIVLTVNDGIGNREEARTGGKVSGIGTGIMASSTGDSVVHVSLAH